MERLGRLTVTNVLRRSPSCKPCHDAEAKAQRDAFSATLKRMY